MMLGDGGSSLPQCGLLQSHFRIVQETVACAAVGEADGYILARRVGGSPDTWSCWAFHVRAGPSRKNGTVLDLPPSLVEWRTCLGFETSEEGTRPGRATVLRIERGTRSFRWCLSRSGETGTQTPQDVREVPSENRRRTTRSLG